MDSFYVMQAEKVFFVIKLSLRKIVPGLLSLAIGNLISLSVISPLLAQIHFDEFCSQKKEIESAGPDTKQQGRCVSFGGGKMRGVIFGHDPLYGCTSNPNGQYCFLRGYLEAIVEDHSHSYEISLSEEDFALCLASKERFFCDVYRGP